MVKISKKFRAKLYIAKHTLTIVPFDTHEQAEEHIIKVN